MTERAVVPLYRFIFFIVYVGKIIKTSDNCSESIPIEFTKDEVSKSFLAHCMTLGCQNNVSC
jgi:hypothetical protein